MTQRTSDPLTDATFWLTTGLRLSRHRHGTITVFGLENALAHCDDFELALGERARVRVSLSDTRQHVLDMLCTSVPDEDALAEPGSPPVIVQIAVSVRPGLPEGVAEVVHRLLERGREIEPLYVEAADLIPAELRALPTTAASIEELRAYIVFQSGLLGAAATVITSVSACLMDSTTYGEDAYRYADGLLDSADRLRGHAALDTLVDTLLPLPSVLQG